MWVLFGNNSNVIANIALGNSEYRRLAINPSGTRLYIANNNASSISVIDTASNSLVATISAISNPNDIFINSLDTKIYVSASQGIKVIDTSNYNVLTTIQNSYGFSPIAINPLGTRIYAGTQNVTISGGTVNVNVIDTSTNSVVATIPIGIVELGDMVFNPSGTNGYVISDGKNINVIDSTKNSVITTIPIAIEKYSLAYMALDLSGTRLYVTNYHDSNVSVIDTINNSIVNTIPVGMNPEGIAIISQQFALTVNKTGDGTISANGINCGTDCAETYNANTQVILTATPTNGYKFVNWSGDCSGTASPLTITMDKAKNCSANFAQNAFTVTLNKTGTGSGTVSGGGNFAAGTTVSLMAAADANSTFTGWSPSPCAASFAMPANDLTCTATFTPLPCTYTLLPASRTHTANAETGSVAVTASNAACAWTASSNQNWSSITTGSSGTGNGTVSYSIQANSATAQRAGTLTIAGQTFNLTQEGLLCSYTLNPTSKTHSANAETGSVAVTASNAACAWTASSNQTWSSITAGNSGTGNGTVSYSVQANSATAQRAGTLTIAGRTFDLIQEKANSSVLPINGIPVPELVIYDQIMKKFMEERNIKAGVLAVMKDGVMVLEHGYGWKDKTLQTPLQPNAMFRLASIVKPITAAAILKLIEEGKVSAGDKAFCVSNSTPPCHLTITPFGTPDIRLKDITIQNLLDHKGGWNRDISGDPMFKSIEIANLLGIDSPPNKQDITRYMMGRPLEYTPGTIYSYSNFGYMLLGLIIEKITGQSYTTYIQDNIFNPIGVADSEVELGHTLPEYRNFREPWYSDPYYGMNVFSPLEIVPWPDGGWYLEAMDSHGGIISTARAMAKFLQYYWINGKPRAGNGQTWWFYGSLDGTHTIAYQRPDGINLVALFNQRSDSSGLDYFTIKSELDVATSNVNWKIVDDSITYLRVINWAEVLYPQLFPIQAKQEFSLPPYQVSYYPTTGTYIGYNPSDYSFYGYNPNLWGDNILFLGTLNEYLSSAQAAGF